MTVEARVRAWPSGLKRRGPSGPCFKEITQKTAEGSRSSGLEGAWCLCRGKTSRKEVRSAWEEQSIFHTVFK